MAQILKLAHSTSETPLDLSAHVATIEPRRVYTANIKVITTLNGREHAFPSMAHDVLDVTLKPLTAATVRQVAAFFEALPSVWFYVHYIDPHTGATVAREMRLTSDWSNKFLLVSVDGETRYGGGRLTFRSK